MAYTLSPNLKLRLDANLTANSKYNLLTLDALGAVYSLDNTGNVNVRSKLNLQFTANDPSVGGSGVGGTVTFGTIAQPLDAFVVNANSVQFTGGIALDDQATGSLGLLNLDYNSQALGEGAADNATYGLTFDVSSGDRLLALGTDFQTTGTGRLTLNTVAGSTVTVPLTGTLATLAGVETLTNKTIDGTQNTLLNLPTSSLSGIVLPSQGGTGVANNDASTLAISGSYPLSLTLGGNTSVALPASGTLATLAGTETFSNKTFSDQLNLTNAGGQVAVKSAATGNWTLTLPTNVGTAGTFLRTDGFGNASWVGAVTSVGFTAPAAVFSVSGSPVTSNGTLGLTFVTQAPGTVFAGPASGGPGAPTFRALVASDIPGGIAPTVADTQSIALTIGGGNVLTADLRIADSTLSVASGGVAVAVGGITNTQVSGTAAILGTKIDIHSLPLKAALAPIDEVMVWDSVALSNKKTQISDLLVGSTSYSVDWPQAAGGTFSLTHNLNTEDVTVQVFDVASGTTVFPDSITRTSLNDITIVSSETPGPSGWRVVVLSAGSLSLSSGTVTSVGLSAPSEFTVTGSPVTTSGTLTFTKVAQSAATVWAGPVSGGSSAPTFRALQTTDIPALPYQPSFTPGSISTSTTGVTVGSGSSSTVGPNVTVDIATSSAGVTGLLTGTDWTTFNSKQAALTPGSISTSTSGVTVTGGAGATVGPAVAINVATSSGSTVGLLTAADWTTFNGKQPAGSYLTALTGDVTASGPGSSVATIANGAITNVKVAAGAAISYSKLALTNSILIADLASSEYSTSNIPLTLVQRDSSGFLTADLVGSVQQPQTLSADLTVPDGYSIIRSKTLLSGTMKLTLLGSSHAHFLG